jgi:hypothetical protein
MTITSVLGSRENRMALHRGELVAISRSIASTLFSRPAADGAGRSRDAPVEVEHVGAAAAPRADLHDAAPPHDHRHQFRYL